MCALCMCRAAAEEAQERETDAKGRVDHLSSELRVTQGQLAQRKQVIIRCSPCCQIFVKDERSSTVNRWPSPSSQSICSHSPSISADP